MFSEFIMTLKQLYKIIEKRKKQQLSDSYVYQLLSKGTDRIVQKIGEEAIEVAIAGKNGQRREIISESADLLFHLLILLIDKKIKLSEIETELFERNNKTGVI